MTRYRKKPVEVEAWQVGTEPVPDWVTSAAAFHRNQVEWDILIDDGFKCIIEEGAYLVKEGMQYRAVPADIFEQAYEVVE